MSQSKILLEVGTNELEIVEFFINERDGYRGYLNSRTQLDEKIRTEFSEDPELTEQAEASARRQVEQLARSVCQSAYVEVRFKGEE